MIPSPLRVTLEEQRGSIKSPARTPLLIRSPSGGHELDPATKTMVPRRLHQQPQAEGVLSSAMCILSDDGIDGLVNAGGGSANETAGGIGDDG